MQILTDGLYNVVDSLYLRKDSLQRLIGSLKYEQNEIYHDMDMHDTYTLFTDLESELETIIDEIEELEYQTGVLELMELDFEKYRKMKIEELQSEAKSYSLSTKGNELELTNRLMVKIYN